MRVINIRNAPSNWRASADFVYIGRGGLFGNPIVLKKENERGSTLKQFKVYFYGRLNTDPVFKQKVLELKGKTLVCFCKPYPCHGDIIADWLNNQ